MILKRMVILFKFSEKKAMLEKKKKKKRLRIFNCEVKKLVPELIIKKLIEIIDL